MSWDDQAATWDTDPVVIAYSAAAFGSLEALLARHDRQLDGARALDFGCGTGLLTAALARAGATVYATDISEPMLDVLRAKAIERVTAVSGPLEAALARGELPDGLDLVCCSSVCAFLPDYPGTVRQLVQRLRPGGVFVQWDWELDPTAEEPFGLTRSAVRDALQSAGLTDVDVDVAVRVPIGEHLMAPLHGVGRRR